MNFCCISLEFQIVLVEFLLNFPTCASGRVQSEAEAALGAAADGGGVGSESLIVASLWSQDVMYPLHPPSEKEKIGNRLDFLNISIGIPVSIVPRLGTVEKIMTSYPSCSL